MSDNRKPSRGPSTPRPRKHPSRERTQAEALEDYLRNDFLDTVNRPNFHPDNERFDMEQPYYTARTSSGHFVHVEGGRPKMKEAAVNQLDGYAWEEVQLAIEMVRRKRPELVDALEWHQTSEAARPHRLLWAADNHVAQQTLHYRMKRAVSQIGDALRDARRIWEGHMLWEWDHGSGVYEHRRHGQKRG